MYCECSHTKNSHDGNEFVAGVYYCVICLREQNKGWLHKFKMDNLRYLEEMYEKRS
jgi:hypothetical protein